MEKGTAERRKERETRTGYRHPPKRGRIKPGEVRNPNGRRGKEKTDPISVAEILNEPIQVTKGGVTRRLHPFEVSIRSLTTRALKGRSIDAALEFIKLCEQYDIIKPTPLPQLGGGVLQVPNDWNWDEWLDMLHQYGPPPWPGKRPGLPTTSWSDLKQDSILESNGKRSTSPSANAARSEATKKKSEPKPREKRPRRKAAQGGPLGRPARKKIVEAVAKEKHTATIGGRKQKRSILELILTLIKLSAAEGNLKGARALHKLLSRYGPQEPVKVGGYLVVPEPPSDVEEYEAKLAEQQAPFRGNLGSDG